MKISSLIICLYIIGYVFSLGEVYNTLFDCEFRKEYVVNMESFPNGYIPDRTTLYFRIPINKKKQNGVTIKLLKDEDNPFHLDFYFFSKKPTDSEAMIGSSEHEWTSNDLTEKGEKYTKYTYPIDDDRYTGNYIVVHLETEDDYNFISILVSSYERKEYYIKEVEYNAEHIIEKLSNYNFNYFQFYLKSQNNENETIRIKLYKDDSAFVDDINIRYYGLTVSPTQYKDSSQIVDMGFFYKFTLNETDNNYIKYYYDYSQLKEEAKYIYVEVFNYHNLKYFSIGIGNNISDSPDSSDKVEYSGYLKSMSLKHALLAFLLFIF